MLVNNRRLIEKLNPEGTHFLSYQFDQLLVETFTSIIDP
jgi:hypothetical protein